MKKLLAVFFVLGLVLAGCGSDSTAPVTPDAPDMAAQVLSGTAAAGAPIIGQVTVKDSSNPVKTKSALIEANGNYTMDVTGLLAPFILRAEGTVGGKTYKLHSYTEAADFGGTVNITPFTDLIVANAAGQLASTLFDTADFSSLTSAEVAAQETALQAKLQTVLSALGVGTAVDLLHTAFSADHTALDAVLDLVRVDIDPVSIQATITNLIDNTSIVDDLENTSDNTAVLQVTSDLAAVQTSQQAIYALYDSFSALFAAGLPSQAQLNTLLADDFLQGDQGRDQFLTELSTDPSLVGLAFSHVVIGALDDTAGTASVTFNVVFNGNMDPEVETWQLVRSGNLWKLRGNQEIVDRWFDYICDFNTQSDGTSFKGCGINLGADDLDFTNNGTGGAPIAAAKVTLLRNDLPVAGGVVYLGTPEYGAAGELRIYDTDYSDDFMAFGSGAMQYDPALLAVGDTLQYELFTADLDLTDPAAPAVSGSPVATYTTAVLALPVTDAANASYPSAAPATLAAFDALTAAGGNLHVVWTVPTGQTIDEVVLMMCDGSTCEEVWTADGLSGTEATLTLDTSGLNPANAPYSTELRVYAVDAQGRSFLRTYHGGTVVTDPGSPGFTAALLDTLSTIYVQYANDDSDNPVGTTTVQELITKTGTNGSYQLSVVISYFNQNGSFLDSDSAGPFTFILNADGTLSADITEPDGTFHTVFHLTSTNGNSITVFGEENSVPADPVNYGSWTDTWYLNTPPAGWLASP